MLNTIDSPIFLGTSRAIPRMPSARAKELAEMVKRFGIDSVYKALIQNADEFQSKGDIESAQQAKREAEFTASVFSEFVG